MCSFVDQCLRQFFLIFVFWALIFCSWVFSTLVGLNARASTIRPNFEVDPQLVVIAAL